VGCYVKLGVCLLLVYAGTAVAYFGPVLGGLALAWNSGILLGWTLATFTASSIVLVWLTIVNLVYLLTQMVIAVEDVGVRKALVGVARFVRSHLREVAGIFGVVLVFVVLATVASILATAGLGLIAFVPLAGFVVFPLTAAGWLLRGFVFQYLALTALGAYLTQYRHYLRGAPAIAAVQGQRFGACAGARFLRTRVGQRQSRVDDCVASGSLAALRVSSMLPVQAPEHVPWADFRTSPASCCPDATAPCCSMARPAATGPLVECIAAIMASRGAATRRSACS
jgi:hypothetical protein